MTQSPEDAELEIKEVPVGDKWVIRNLMQLYRYDMSPLLAVDVDSHGLFDYKHLDHYWTPQGRAEGRVPYLFFVQATIVDFALKNGYSYRGSSEPTSNVAEFFVMKRWRGRGIGRRAACQLFDAHRGHWEVAQMRANVEAQAFWTSVIRGYTLGRYTVTDSRDDRWDGQVLSFRS